MKDKKGKIFNLNDIKKSDSDRKISKKKVALAIILGIIIIAAIVFLCIYSANDSLRKQLDQYLTYKNVRESNLPYINIENHGDFYTFAWDNNIAILSNKSIVKYDSFGKNVSKINVEISNPLIDTKNDYAVIAEKDGNKIYLLKKNSVIWEKDVEGTISRVKVNKNGYVAAIVSGTTYKSVISVYDDEGEELFKTYLSSAVAANVDISENNKYLAFSEINMSGTTIQSNVKIISIDKAKDRESSEDAIVYAHNGEQNALITDLEYKSRDRLVCMYDNAIYLIEDEEATKVIDIDKNDLFEDIKLNNQILKIYVKNKELLKTNVDVSFINIDNQKTNSYELEGTVKRVECYLDKVAINIDKDIYFISNNGWLLKKYTSEGEIKDIIMTNSIVGIVYKNKIELISL